MSGIISGACIVSKLSGMVYIREDETPSVIEWVAIDQSKKVTIPLHKLTNLQASKETTPKLMLKLFYKVLDPQTNQDKDKDVKLTFSNRPTMNNIKDALQAIMARSRTTIKDLPSATSTPTPAPGTPNINNASTTTNNNTTTSASAGTASATSSSGPPGSQASATNPGAAAAAAAATASPSPAVVPGLDFSNPRALSDDNLLKNHILQQKLLLEDKTLRDKFTQAVINYKLSPVIFWQTRLNQLRTYALTISQHRGPYNVLSTIKPVATSDNQVNVNVTRDTIREIFETYPIIKKSFDDLVPSKFPEGEFWSRFFNSKLFRRLRGDRINNSNERGDVILDKYLYVDQNFLEEEEKRKKKRAREEMESEGNKSKSDGSSSEDPKSFKRQKSKESGSATTSEAVAGASGTSDAAAAAAAASTSAANSPETHHVNKFIDLVGNEDDNSQKLGNKPDITMRYGDANISNLLNSKNKREIGHSSVGAGVENEMLVIMRNMNRLSEKIVASIEDAAKDDDYEASKGNDNSNVNEYASELGLNDLNETKEVQYVKLDFQSNPTFRPTGAASQAAKSSSTDGSGDVEAPRAATQTPKVVLKSFMGANKFSNSPIDLTDTFATKKADIDKTSVEINSLIKHNFRTYRMVTHNGFGAGNGSAAKTSPATIIPPSLIQDIKTIHLTSMELLSHFWRCFNSGDQAQANQTRKIVISLKKCLAQYEVIEEKCTELINEFSTEEKVREKLVKEVKECLSCDRNGLNKACREYGQALAASEKGEGTPVIA